MTGGPGRIASRPLMSAVMTDPNLDPHEAQVDDETTADPALGLFGALGEDARLKPGFTVPDSALLMRMYREMKRVRLLDERMVMLQRQGRVGFYGACTGQEAAVVATGLAAAPEDWIFPALRENAVMLVRGFPLISYVAQIYGSAIDTPPNPRSTARRFNLKPFITAPPSGRRTSRRTRSPPAAR